MHVQYNSNLFVLKIKMKTPTAIPIPPRRLSRTLFYVKTPTATSPPPSASLTRNRRRRPHYPPLGVWPVADGKVFPDGQFARLPYSASYADGPDLWPSALDMAVGDFRHSRSDGRCHIPHV